MAERAVNKYRVPLKVPQGAESYVRFAPPIKAPNLLGDIRTKSYTNPDFGASHVFVGQVQRPGPLKEYVAFTTEKILSTLDLMTELSGHHRQWGYKDFNQTSWYGNGLKREDYGGLAGRTEKAAFDPYKQMFEQDLLSQVVIENVKDKLTHNHLRGGTWPSFKKGKVVYEDDGEGVVVTASGETGLTLNLGNIRQDHLHPRPDYRVRSQLWEYDDEVGSSKTVNWFYPTMRWQSDEFGQRVVSVNPMDDELFFACYSRFLRSRSGHAYDVTGYNSEGLTFAPDRFNPLVGLMTVAYMMKREGSLWRTKEELASLHEKPWAVPLFLVGKMPNLAKSEFYEKCEEHFKQSGSQTGQKAA